MRFSEAQQKISLLQLLTSSSVSRLETLLMSTLLDDLLPDPVIAVEAAVGVAVELIADELPNSPSTLVSRTRKSEEKRSVSSSTVD